MINNVSYEEKSRERFFTIMMIIGAVVCFWHIWCISEFSYRVILQESFEEAMYPAGVLTGLLSMAAAFYWRDFNVDLIFFGKVFLPGVPIGALLFMGCCEYYIYLFADHVIGYESEYEVTIPGPKKDKSHYYEAGIWINDQNTHRRFHLATTKAYLRDHPQRGTIKVWVTARINNIGSYIMSYEFIHNGICEPDGTNPKQQDYFRECWP